MNWLKAAPALVSLVAITLVVGCESSPSSPDLNVAPPAVADPSGALSATGPLFGRGNNPGLGVIYVTSQGLYYDTFATADPLPPHGRFQELRPTTQPGATGETDYGPGQPGYLGGRWKMGDHYFLCPLLGPGREEP